MNIEELYPTDEELSAIWERHGLGETQSIVMQEQTAKFAIDNAVKKIVEDMEFIDKETQGDAQYYNAMRHLEQALKELIK